jgi:hypothetical protein
MQKSTKKLSLLLIVFINCIFLLNCSGTKVDPVTGKAEKFEPNADVRGREYAEKNPITLFGGSKSENKTNFEFSTSNILWRATFKTLDFLPLTNADYTGGIIITDWYSENKNSKDQIKIQIRFLSNELRSDSLSVTGHKKTCDNQNSCSYQKLDNTFLSSIKESILNTARIIKIEESKKN